MMAGLLSPWRLEFLDFHLFQFSGVPITVATLIIFVLIVLLTLAASKAIRAALRHALHARGVAEEGGLAATLRLVHYAILALGLGVALEMVGVDLAAVFAAGVIFAIAIGFAMQNIVQNFVSGVILLFGRSIKPGDVLRVGDLMGRVVRMGLRATVVRTPDDEDVILPNTMLVQSPVAHLTLHHADCQVRARVGVAGGADLARARQVLEEAAAALPWRVESKPPQVLWLDLGRSAVDFEVCVWIHDAWEARRARSDMNEALWRALTRAGVPLARAQADAPAGRAPDAPLTSGNEPR